MSEGWTKEWPKEPGLYLFYGHRKSDQSEKRLRWRLVTVVIGGDGLVHRYAESEFFYESEQYGRFKKFTEAPPSLDD